MALTSHPESSRFSYCLQPWGDLIRGSKKELQALGLGQGFAFPGEPSGAPPRGALRITDPRGFPCKIKRAEYLGEGQFSASITIPGRERPAPILENYAPGVLRRSIIWGEEYTGSAEALVAAGVVAPGQFPGLPGMRKTIVTIMADGRVFDGTLTSNKPPAAHAAGAKQVIRKSAQRFAVVIRIAEDAAEARHLAWIAAEAEHEAKLRAMPRPQPLVPLDGAAIAQARRAQLRLVWSRPAPAASR